MSENLRLYAFFIITGVEYLYHNIIFLSQSLTFQIH